MNKDTVLYDYITNLLKNVEEEYGMFYDNLFCKLSLVFEKTRMYQEWRVLGTISYVNILIKWLEEVNPQELTSQFTNHELIELFSKK